MIPLDIKVLVLTEYFNNNKKIDTEGLKQLFRELFYHFKFEVRLMRNYFSFRKCRYSM